MPNTSESESGLSQHSPISTLEDQYVEPIGQRVCLFIRTNEKCCLNGGVEVLLKKMKSKTDSGRMTGTNPGGVDGSGSSAGGTTGGGILESYAQSLSIPSDPFSFLYDSSDPAPSSTRAAETTDSSSSTSHNKKIANSMTSFFKKVAKTTTQSLERGMQELAIRTDPAGRGPDLYTLALYDSEGSLLSATDSVVPRKDTLVTTDGGIKTTNDVGLNQATATDIISSSQRLVFAVPLILPPPKHSEEKNNQVVIKLWIKSQAFFKKHYLLGWVSVNVIQLRDLVAYQPHATLSLTLTSPYFINGEIDIVVSRDLKIVPSPNHRGWSLIDPKMSGYTSGSFNLPLDQSYNLTLPSSLTSRTSHNTVSPKSTNNTRIQSQNGQQAQWVIGTERAVESAIVLPLATALANLYADTAQVSCNHAVHVAKKLLANRHDAPQSISEKFSANCGISLGLLQMNDEQTSGPGTGFLTSATCALSWQPADCIFEAELLPQTVIPVEQPVTTEHMTGKELPNFNSAASLIFYPRVCTANILPTILQAYGGKLPSNGFCLGNLKVKVVVRRVKNNQNPIRNQREKFMAANSGTSGRPNGNVNSNVNDSTEVLESILVLETMANRHKSQGGKISVALYNARTGIKAATLILSLEVNVNHQQQSSLSLVNNNRSDDSMTRQVESQSNPPNSRNGLVSLMSLDSLSIVDGCTSPLDSCSLNVSIDERRRNQIQTLGSFVSHSYLDNHIATIRSKDKDVFCDRAYQYQKALSNAAAATSPRHAGQNPIAIEKNHSNNNNIVSKNNEITGLEVHEVRSPRAFRPSSSRTDVLLSGIPFNVHVASFSIDVFGNNNNSASTKDQSSITSQSSAEKRSIGIGNHGATFSNITCGAPADHAKGFSNIFATYKGAPNLLNASGGLRRLEAKRIELANQVHAAQTNLIAGASNFFNAARLEGQKYVNHIPAKNLEIQGLRHKVFETVQAYHHLTWHCAVRRANCFSQALCIAISSYLTSLSDVTKIGLGWAEIWAKHGYLVSFEGLLSAAGKELGMIEDASVAIEMLRKVSVMLSPADGSASLSSGNEQTYKKRVLIPHSSVLKWIQIIPKSNGLETQFSIEIGIHSDYFHSSQQIPECLKNNVGVSLYPLLFQVGVDIRQWGAHAGSNMKNQFSNNNNMNEDNNNAAGAIGGLLDDDDDDEGIPDDDVLVALNHEAFQKMNVYAYEISPINYGGDPPPQLQQQNPTNQNTSLSSNNPSVAHPSLAMLHGHIVTSAGRMNHSILDEAATIAQQLGGGGAVFCKSGKDRTAMHLTYKQAQFVNRYRIQQHQLFKVEVEDTTLQDANTMRIYGTRLPICEKNVGQALYAFNALQVKFMPDALKPPPNTLAGFLKGGRVFGPGGIES